MADAADTTTDEILSYLQAFNIEPNDRDVVDKCVELCRTYGIAAEDFVDQWVAYTVLDLSGTTLSLEGLEQLERDELQIQLPPTKVVSNGKQQQQTLIVDDEQLVPIKSQQQEKTIHIIRNDEELHVLLTYGDGSSIITQDQEQCDNGNNHRIALKLYGVDNDGESWLTAVNVRYLYEEMSVKARTIDNVTERIANKITKKYQLMPSAYQLRNYFGEMCVYGRIYFDSDTGEINCNSIIFEGTSERQNRHTVKLILNKLDRYALFSGQIVVLEGLNCMTMKENNFICNRIYTDAALVTTRPPPLRGGYKIIVAAGPFTMSDNLEYKPLNDLIKYMCKNPPDLIVLLGPFIDRDHNLLIRMNEEFESLFNRLLDSLMNALDKAGAADVEVVVVPSEQDAHNHTIFPTPPYAINHQQQKSSNNHLFANAPNPCILDVQGGLIVGATATDVLLHLSEQELFFDREPKATEGTEDRIARLIRHLFHQCTFYPLHPPDINLSVDSQLLAQYGRLDCRPHLLILPSTLQYFVMQVDGCLVVNPERLVKELVAGTFARIEIGGGDGDNSICDRTVCQILHI